MVEYRFDDASGRECLMEINGRFWGSIPLAHYSGAHLFWATYTCLAQGREPNQSMTSDSLRCRAVVTETKRLLRILFATNKIQDPSVRFSRWRELVQYCLLFFDPRVRYFVFSWKDIVPAFADFYFAGFTTCSDGGRFVIPSACARVIASRIDNVQVLHTL